MSNAASVTDATRLVQAIERGDPRAADELFPLVYDELRRMARAQMAGLPSEQTLQPTALVHEAYLRLLGRKQVDFEGSRHFFFAAARAMHDILVERARAKSTKKRGGRGVADGRAIDPRAFRTPTEIAPDDMLALHDALGVLQQADPRRHQVVMLRFFAGLTTEQVARATNVSVATVERDWRFARAQLHQQMSGG